MVMERAQDETQIIYAEDAVSADRLHTIGDLAREFGVTLRALRFYEDKGLISPRREGLTRLYTSDDRSRLQLILKGKRLGFTLAEISDMVEAHGRKTSGENQSLKLSREKCLDQIAHLETQKVEIEAAIAELRRTYDTLTALLTNTRP